MKVFNNLLEFKTFRKSLDSKLKIALVPTMGNLHQGHIALMKNAKTLSDKLIATIFINPLQFNDKNDFIKYPRTLQKDLDLLKSIDCDIVLAPPNKEIFTNNIAENTFVYEPILSEIYEGKFRPNHFKGVCTIITKFFNITNPHLAFFGEKDYQQLQIIKKMALDLNMDIKIIGSPTIRTKNGLALSSRNNLLNKDELKRAGHIYQALLWAKKQILKTPNPKNYKNIELLAKNILIKNNIQPNYFAIVNQNNFNQPSNKDTKLQILVAAYINNIRLIDNIECNI